MRIWVDILMFSFNSNSFDYVKVFATPASINDLNTWLKKDYSTWVEENYGFIFEDDFLKEIETNTITFRLDK